MQFNCSFFSNTVMFVRIKTSASKTGGTKDRSIKALMDVCKFRLDKPRCN